MATYSPPSHDEPPTSAAAAASTLWSKLTEPDSSIQNPTARRQARLLSSLLLSVIPLVTTVIILRSIIDPAFTLSPISVGGIVALIAAYVLSRTELFEWGGALAVVIFPAAIFSLVLTSPNPNALNEILAYLVLGVLLSSVLFSTVTTIVVVVFDLGIIASLPILIPGLSLTSIVPTLTFLGLTSAAVVVIKQHRDQLEADRQAEIAESQRTLATLMSNMPGLAYRCRNDEQWTMEFVSEGALEMTGYAPADLLHNQHLAYADLIHPDDRDQVWEGVQSALREERPFTLSYRIINRDGTEKWVWEQGRAVTLPDGRQVLEGFITNVTERRQAEEQLRKLSRAVEQSGAAILITDVDGIIEFVNPTFTRLTGYSPEEALGQTPRLLRSGLNPPEMYADLWETIKAGNVWNGELRNRRKNGETYWITLTISPVRDKTGTVTHLVGVEEEITEQKKAQETLRQYNRRLENLHAIDRAILSAESPELTAANALHHLREVVACQQASVTLIDLAADEFWVLAQSVNGESRLKAGRRSPLTDFSIGIEQLRKGEAYVADDSASLAGLPAALQTTQAGELQASMNVPLLVDEMLIGSLNIHKAATDSFSQDDMVLTREVADQLAIAIQSARLRENLEQTVAERTRELERARTRAETILDSVGDGVIVISPDGKIQQVNPALEEQTGYSAQELAGQYPQAFIPDEPALQALYQEPLAAIESQLAWQGELPIVRKDSTMYDAAVTVAPMRSENDELRQSVISLRDISPLKEVERMKDAFVSNVSHELRSPLTGLTLYLDLLEKAVPDDVRDRYLPNLKREGRRLNRIIEDVLGLSRLDQNRVKMQFAALDLNAIVEPYVADRQPLAEERGLTLTFEGQADLPEIEADPGLLSQVLGVLLTNALNYTPTGGQVSVTTAAKEEANQEWAGFSIADNGPGIPPQEQDKLFQRFFRGFAGRESNAPGTGLGLAIAREIVERHSGRIDLESEGIPGAGTTFSVWFPVS